MHAIFRTVSLVPTDLSYLVLTFPSACLVHATFVSIYVAELQQAHDDSGSDVDASNLNAATTQQGNVPLFYTIRTAQEVRSEVVTLLGLNVIAFSHLLDSLYGSVTSSPPRFDLLYFLSLKLKKRASLSTERH